MRARFVIPAAALAALLPLVAGAGRAAASDGDGQNTFVGAQASGGQLTVSAGRTYWTPPAGSSWATEGKSDPPPSTPGTTNPDQPYGCTYTAGGPSATASIGVGGPEPGQWVFPECSGPGPVDPMPPVWVTGAQPDAGTVQVDPVEVGQQAVKQLALGSPTIEMAPPDGSPQLVNVATWLWIDPAAWQPLMATATAGPVTATATAAPSKVEPPWVRWRLAGLVSRQPAGTGEA